MRIEFTRSDRLDYRALDDEGNLDFAICWRSALALGLTARTLAAEIDVDAPGASFEGCWSLAADVAIPNPDLESVFDTLNAYRITKPDGTTHDVEDLYPVLSNLFPDLGVREIHFSLKAF